MKIWIKIDDLAENNQRAVHVDKSLSHHLEEDQLQKILDESRLQEWNKDPQKGQALGQAIWQLLNGTAWQFQTKVDEAYKKGASLHLHFELPYEIDSLPVELLYHHNFLLLKGETHIFRSVSERNQANQKALEKHPLRLLFMAASPSGGGSTLNFEKEEEDIFAQTEKLPIDLMVEEMGSLESLEEKLQELTGVDVIHLSGHAGMDLELGPVFYLEDEVGNVDPVTPERLWKAIRDYPPKLLFLSGCETAKSDKVNSAASFAYQMVEQGCPALLGWGLKVSDGGATQMTAELYKYLALGKPLDFAIMRARQLMENNYHPWPLLRHFGDASPIVPLIAPGQKLGRRQRKPSQVVHKILQDSDVKVIAKGFVGRRKAIQKGIRILRAYDPDKYGLLITGPAGIGKSALAGRIIERFPTRKLLVFSRKLSEGQFFAGFRKFFEKEGLQEGIQILENPDLDYAGKIKELFRSVFSAQELIMYWDNFEDNLEQRANQHYLRAESAQVISPFLEALDWAEGAVSLMISSRYPFSLEIAGNDLVKHYLEEIPLASMRGAELKKKQERLPRINESEHTELYLEIGKGNPRLLEWLEEIAQKEREKELDLEKLREALEAKSEEYRSEYLAKILAQTEGEEFLSFLKKASVYRKPEPAKAYEGIGDTHWLPVAQGLTLMESDESGGEPRYWVHPVLQTQFWEDLEEEEQQNLHLIALDYYEVLIKAAKQAGKSPSFEDCEEGYFHALSSANHLRACLPAIYIAKTLENALLYKTSVEILEKTLKELSEQEIEEALKKVNQEQDQGIEILDNLAMCYNNVGGTWGDLGDHQKALEYLEKSLQLRLEIYGEKHPDVATSYNNVGYTWGYLGNHPKALEYQEKALWLRLEIYGEKHPDVASSYNNVGMTWGYLGDHPKALEYLEKALRLQLEIYEEKHPDVATSYNNLGMTWGYLGDHEKALEYQEKALRLQLEIYGEKHPDVASSYNNVGMTWNHLGDQAKALEYQEKALRLSLDIYGEKHPDVATSYNNVGGTWGYLGDHPKALEHQEKALRLLIEIYGEKHPDVAMSYNNVGSTWGYLGDHQKALQYQEKALRLRLNIYRENHPLVASSYNNVGYTWGYLGDHQKALEYKEKSLRLHLEIYGEKHPGVANSYNNVGYTWGYLGDHQKALEYKEKSLRLRLEIYGEHHPDVASSYNNVGGTYQALENYEQAKACFGKALIISLLTLGQDHPHTRTFYGNLVGLLESQGKSEEEIQAYLQELVQRMQGGQSQE